MAFKDAFQRILIGLFLLSIATGCESLKYYGQAISGQMQILKHRKPIEKVISDPQTSSLLKSRLQSVLAIRQFARDVLHLPLDGNYLSYADVGRSYAVWNVYAAPELSLSPKTWCYPVVGCLAYRGFFSETGANLVAEKLNIQGFDTYVGGVAAYSTLGWFDDPVLNTFAYRSEAKLAALIFHELAHLIFYVSDDTTFNESFATAVEREGMRRWLAQQGITEAFDVYLKEISYHQAFVRLILSFKNELETLYGQSIPPRDMRAKKGHMFLRLRSRYNEMKKKWNGYAGYDKWFDSQLNNAKLLTVSAYHDLVPAFSALLKSNKNDLPSFYKKCRDLAKKSRQDRRAELRAYISD